MSAFLALACLALALGLVAVLWRRNEFHPAIFFILFASVDVFFPAVYWQFFGQTNTPDWMRVLEADEVLAGLVFYVAYFGIFIAVLLAVDGDARLRLPGPTLTAGQRSKLSLVLWVLLALTLVKMVLEVSAFGGIEPWLQSRIVFAAVPGLDGAAPSGGTPLAFLPAREMLQAAAGLAFFYRRQFSRSWIVSVMFPMIVIALAMLTFLRGSVLTCAITLIFAEIMRRRFAPVGTFAAPAQTRRVGPLAMGLVAGVLSIYVFGSVRDTFRGLSDAENAEVEWAVPAFLTSGHGLLGVSHITSEYGRNVDHLGGKTYIDMLLLPVPRSIYTSKPEWYGIDDITRGMGWPESTQSAVTMPGEAFANFGIFGLFVAAPAGLALGLLHRFLRSDQTRYVLIAPVLCFQVASVTSWMSFTGFMNAVPLLVLLLILAAMIGPAGARPRRQGASDALPAGGRPASQSS